MAFASNPRALPPAALLFISIVAIWVGVSSFCWLAYRHALDLATARTDAMAHAFAEYTVATVQLIDSAMQGARDDWVSDRELFDRTVRRLMRDPARIYQQIGVVDATGRLTYSDQRFTTATDLSDREHVRVHLGGGPDRLFISAPLLGRVSGKWSIQFSRPIMQDDRTVGVIVFSVAPDHFQRFIKRIPLGESEAIAVVRASGEVLARFPEHNDDYLGRKISGAPFLAADAPLHGQYRRLAQTDNVERLISFTRIPALGLSTVAGTGVETALRPFRVQCAAALTAGLLLTALAMFAYRLNRRNRAERERHADQLRAINAQLEDRIAQRTAEIETFMYAVSHDVRGPLRRVDGFAMITLDRLDEGDSVSARHFLQRIRHGANQLTLLLDGLLDLSRSSMEPLRLESVDMHKAALAALDKLGGPPAGVGVDIAALPPCRADPVLIEQVWVNLIGNAIKYSSRCEKPAIRIGYDEAEACYFVSDNGAGFDPSHLNKLFMPLSRLHSETEFPGSGFGLAIVKRIVERHGGSVAAESVKGQGATFRFSIPD